MGDRLRRGMLCGGVRVTCSVRSVGNDGEDECKRSEVVQTGDPGLFDSSEIGVGERESGSDDETERLDVVSAEAVEDRALSFK